MVYILQEKSKLILSNGPENGYYIIRKFQQIRYHIKPKLFILLILLFFGTLINISINLQSYKQNKPNFNQDLENTTEGFLIFTPGCKIPDFDPFDTEIQPFFINLDPIICNKGQPDLFESNLTSIYLLNSSLPSYNITNITELYCCYKTFWRIDVGYNETDDKIIFNNDCINITNTTIIDKEFIKVTCNYNNNEIYKDMFSFVPIKENLYINKSSNLNVLILGLDAVSRLNLYRQLPKTVDYIKSIGAIELLGYNKVGDNTFPNLIPVLTGLNESELVDNCWTDVMDHFDNCTFIWNNYKDKGYVTAYGEDASWMGLFNYERNGFHKQPTDYGYNYFSRYIEYEIGNEDYWDIEMCENARLVYKDLLNYIKKFVITMTDNNLPYFGFFWGVSLSHNDLNLPKLGDDDYYNFFKDHYNQGLLDNTAVIFMSDHGIRWGDIRNTYQGRMEERLPFVYLLLPDWFKEQYPQYIKNLIKNTRRLTTPFDLHETLIDLLYPSNINDTIIENSRGISLFKEINKQRTCKDAGIVSHWCTCQQSINIKTNDSIIKKSANYAIKHINNKLLDYKQCANLTLVEINNARLITHEDDDLNKFQDYLITIRTVPGDGLFETTVRYKSDDDNFNVIGTVSRLNLYGNQSICISDFHLKLYCYCIN